MWTKYQYILTLNLSFIFNICSFLFIYAQCLCVTSGFWCPMTPSWVLRAGREGYVCYYATPQELLLIAVKSQIAVLLKAKISFNLSTLYPLGLVFLYQSLSMRTFGKIRYPFPFYIFSLYNYILSSCTVPGFHILPVLTWTTKNAILVFIIKRWCLYLRFCVISPIWGKSLTISPDTLMDEIWNLVSRYYLTC